MSGLFSRKPLDVRMHESTEEGEHTLSAFSVRGR